MIQGVSSTAFWDVNFDKLDPDLDSIFIIERVMDKGLFDDIIAILDYYPQDRIKHDIIKARSLSKKTLALCSSIFEIPKNEFKCFLKTQSSPQLWSY